MSFQTALDAIKKEKEKNLNMPFQTVFDTLKKFIDYAILIGIAALIIFLFWKSVFVTEAGYIYHEQNLLTGKIIVHINKPKINFRAPFSFRLNRYTQAWTVNFGISYGGYQIRRKGPIQVRFADTYTAKVPATFRYKLPVDKGRIKMIHQEFRGFEELIDSLLIKTSRDVMVNTATQYTGEEFFLGGFNQFKAALTDQLRDGIYKTERKQVEIEQTGLAPIGLEQEESMRLQKTKTLVWKTVPVIDSDGKPMRLENPLDPYGIEVTQITLGEPIAEPQLEKMLTEKKRLLAERIEAMQEQETTMEQAKTVQLKADIERIRAKQEAIKIKELAIITKQREIKEAELQTEKEVIEYEKATRLAVIKKEKELAIAKAEQEIRKARKGEELIIAKANQDIRRANKEAQLIVAQEEKKIQKANFEAAQFKAKAIREIGIAEADVLNATYKARIPEIYLAELQREIANIIYPNLKGINVKMPRNIVTLGGKNDNKLQTNLDVLSSFATIGVMEGLEKKALDSGKLSCSPP